MIEVRSGWCRNGWTSLGLSSSPLLEVEMVLYRGRMSCVLPPVAPGNHEEDQLREAREWEQKGQQTASQIAAVWYQANIESGHNSEQAI